VTLRKITFGEILAGLAAALLVADLFAPWFGDESAWESLTVVLALLLIVAGLGLTLLGATLFQRSQAFPVAAEVFAFAFAAPTFVVVLLVAALRDGADWGAWAGVVLVAGVAAGAWAAMRSSLRRP